MDNKYFIVTVVEAVEVAEGKLKNKPIKFLVSGYNMTDVETKITKEYDGTTINYSIKSVVDSNIKQIIN